MNNVNLQVNDIAVIKELAGADMTAYIAKQYDTDASVINSSEVTPFHCLASNDTPVELATGIYVNRCYIGDHEYPNQNVRFRLYNGLALKAFDFFSKSGWNGAFRVVSFRDNGPLGLIHVGIVHELVLNEFLQAYPRANVGETNVNCGLTLPQMRGVISDLLYHLPSYNNASDILRHIKGIQTAQTAA